MTLLTVYNNGASGKSWAYWGTHTGGPTEGEELWDNELWLVSPAKTPALDFQIDYTDPRLVGRDQSAVNSYSLMQHGIKFDTSGIPDTAVIASVSLRIGFTGNSSVPGWDSTYPWRFQARIYDWSDSPSEADVRTGATSPTWWECPLFASLDGGSGGGIFSNYTFTSEPGAAGLLNRTGFTKLIIGIDEYDGPFPGFGSQTHQYSSMTGYRSSQFDTTFAPQLIVDHSPGVWAVGTT